MNEEADSAIESSYKEGYKQGVIEFKPEAEYWQNKYKKDNSFSSALKKIAISAGCGLMAGVLITLAIN